MAELDGYIKWWTAGVEKALSDSVVGKFADKLEPSKQSISASKEGSKNRCAYEINKGEHTSYARGYSRPRMRSLASGNDGLN